MGFLRQRKDGSTSLAILVPGNGVTPGTNEQPVSLGALTGKLTHGTGQLQGFREDRRNLAKTVKPLYYGAFGSYAPSYDSTFANLTKEESDLVYQTYGDDTAVQYAERYGYHFNLFFFSLAFVKFLVFFYSFYYLF